MKEETNLWLKKLFNADYFDAWLAVSYLYRYPTVGIHYYICNKLQYSKDVIVVLPQLVHVYLYHADTEVSIPIYNLLKVLSSKSKRFFCAIYFYLKAYIDSEDTKKSIYCYFLICDIFQEEKKILLKNTKILRTQLQYKRRIGRTQGIGRETKGHHSFDGIFLYFLKSVTWMLDGDDDLNKESSKVDDGSKSDDIRKSPSLNKESPSLNNDDHPSFSSSNGSFLKEVINYENIFIPSKNISNINLNLELDSGSAFRSESLKSSINLLLTLIEISQRLKKLPKNLRQKGLEMELKLINCNLPGKLSLPFSTSNYILNIQIELSHVLNSADNVPYVVVFEVADQGISSNTHVNDELRNASLIMQQLNTVSGLAYLSDINNIKENVISSLEKILNTERSPVPITTYSEKQIKRKEIISKKVSERVQKLTSNKKEKIEKVKKDKIETVIDYDSIFFTNKNDKLPNESSINLDNNKNIIDFYQDDWKIKEKNIKNKSPYSHLKGWRLSSMIVKTGNNLKQEIVAYQILNEMKKIWKDENKDIWIKTYRIYFINNTSGLVETVTNAYSIHKIKEMGQGDNKNFSLKNYFLGKYGRDSKEYKMATQNFLKSLVGYSLASYILQIKDRHNGNILLDNEGHVVHVDFGFILGEHPGFYCVEVAPFKFSSEYLDLLDDLLEEFKMLFLEGFIALRKHSERLCRIIEILSENSDVRCINKRVLMNFRDRLKMEMSDKEIEIYVMWLINKSLNSMGTGLYDSYQYFSNGYL